MTIIVPIAANKAEYDRKLPQPFRLDDEGTMFCVKAIMGLPLDEVENIYFVILRSHEERFMLSEQLSMQFRRHKLGKAHVTILDQPTNSQAETVARAIETNNINGTVFIKDGKRYRIPREKQGEMALKSGMNFHHDWPRMNGVPMRVPKLEPGSFQSVRGLCV